MSTPKVSVIIPNYNYGRYLRKTIDSVLAQSYPNVEVVVVDDGSKDNSLEILREYEGKVLTIEQRNGGVSSARNSGVKNSDGEFVAFLDADDLWLPEKLEKQIAKFQANPEIGMVHCAMTYIDAEDRVKNEIETGLDGWISEEFLRFERSCVVGAGSTALVPRAVFDEVGGFDSRQTTAADWDFSYRIASKYEIGYVRESLVLYRLHGTNMHGNIAAMEHDMLLGYEKAFANGATANPRESYGNLHKTLAGSYFHVGNYRAFARHALKSFWNRPSNIIYFAQYPIRRFRRK